MKDAKSFRVGEPCLTAESPGEVFENLKIWKRRVQHSCVNKEAR